MRGAGSRLFYGWYVVFGAFLTTFAAFGGAYTFSAFLEPLQHEFSATRGEISLVFSIAGFLYFFLGVISGPLADRFGVRPLCLIGICLIATGFAIASWAQTLTGVLIAYGVGVGVGVGFAYVPALGIVQRWFLRRRALASGIAVSGIGVGTLVMPPLATWLIESLGWRQAYLAIAGLVIVLGLTAVALMRDDPHAMELEPDGDEAVVVPQMVGGDSVSTAIGSTPFAYLYAANLCAALGAFVPFVHLIPFATDLGVSAEAAAFLIAAIGLGSTVGRFALGGFADRVGRLRSLAVMMAGMGLALCLWAVSQNFALLVLFSATFGVFYGGWVAVLPALVADLFGRKHISGIIGAQYTSVAFGTLCGPAAAGFLFDWTGSYLQAILASSGAAIIGAILVGLSARVPMRSSGSRAC
jgi:MFS family permease